jgi:hypothetical protein
MKARKAGLHGRGSFNLHPLRVTVAPLEGQKSWPSNDPKRPRKLHP